MAGVEPFQFEPMYSTEEMEFWASIEEEGEEGESQETRQGRRDWCSCGNCVEMPTEVECCCCQELDELNDKFDVSGVLTI